MPAGEEVTVPLPLPAFVTVRTWLTGFSVKVAVTAFGASMVTWQAPDPEHAPLQPAKVDPAAGEAVRLTTVPAGKLALHVGPQSMPAGEEVTVPLPLPAFVTVRVWVPPPSWVKVAVTSFGAFMVTWQAP